MSGNAFPVQTLQTSPRPRLRAGNSEFFQVLLKRTLTTCEKKHFPVYSAERGTFLRWTEQPIPLGFKLLVHNQNDGARVALVADDN